MIIRATERGDLLYGLALPRFRSRGVGRTRKEWKAEGNIDNLNDNNDHLDVRCIDIKLDRNRTGAT